LTPLGSAAGITRENLSQRVLVTLERGSWKSPDVLLVESDRGRAVVKDFAPRARLVRATLGRLLIRRELAIYRALAGLPAVPRIHGRIDRFAFALEHRGGVRITRRRPWTFSPAFVEALRAAVAGLHARGVVHLDLSHRSNVRAAPDGSPVLIDFEASLRFRPGGLAGRTLLPLLRKVDERALAKWAKLAAGEGRPGARPDQPGGASEGGRGARRPT
jgi:hypothetical protein